MTTDVESLGQEETVRKASRRLADRDIGMVVVVDKRNHPVGILTDRDIVTRAVARGLDLSLTAIREVMTPDPVCCSQDERLVDAAGLMAEHRIRRVPVLDRDEGALTGVVSLGDLAHRIDRPEMAGQVLGRVCEPA